MITDTISEKDNLIDFLKTGIVSVKFKKVDGSERTMRCTLQENYIQPYDNKTDRVRPDNDNLLSVWDIDKNAWRSFRLDSVIDVYLDI